MRETAACLLVALGIGLPAFGSGEGMPPFDLTGTWAVMQVTSDIVVYPFVGQRIRTTTLILHVEMGQTGSIVTVSETHCLVDTDDGTGMVVTEIPDAFLRSLGTVDRIATLEGTGEGWRFVEPWPTEVHGARLADPVSDPLPTTADDPRMFDQDGDGQPGITVRVRVLGLISGEVYVVQRLSKLLDGQVLAPDLIRGLLTWTNEQVTLGASNPFLNAGGEAQVDPVRERSYFVAIRVPAGTTCANLTANWRTLFDR
ncbi:MAG TPA: hypothetical protein PKG50_02020 [Candidatus Bipolaricaulis anaerobius]|nr:hypothetical protein [Candidatus Bipolaricaulis anaerobius]HNS23720.1 hypothetical protein [Candidatus Bipolaricaulis anaerobius]